MLLALAPEGSMHLLMQGVAQSGVWPPGRLDGWRGGWLGLGIAPPVRVDGVGRALVVWVGGVGEAREFGR